MTITKEKWSLIIKLLVTIVTTIAGTLGLQSCGFWS